jgi:hypothetical protein
MPLAASGCDGCGRTGSGGQQEGICVERATVSADGETITVHVPMTFRNRGGRKRV